MKFSIYFENSFPVAMITKLEGSSLGHQEPANEAIAVSRWDDIIVNGMKQDKPYILEIT